MKNWCKYCFILSSTILLAASCSNTEATFGPKEPANNEMIPLLTNELKEYLSADYSVEVSDQYYKDGVDAYEPMPINFTWSGEATHVELSKDEEFTDPREIEITTDYFYLTNFESNTRYYWRIKNNDEISKLSSFVTEDTIRTLTISGVSNARDAGVWKIYDSEGKESGHIRQGLLFRSGNLNNTTYLGEQTILKDLKIKTELDLRDPEKEMIMTHPFVTNYINISSPMYADPGIFYEEDKQAVKDIISVFANKDNYPIIYHCAIGRDRTGTIAVLLGGLLGMSIDDLSRDYDLSFYVTGDDTDYPSAMHRSVFNSLISKLKRYKSNELSFQENVEAYLLDIGIKSEQIATIKEVLIEPNRGL